MKRITDLPPAEQAVPTHWVWLDLEMTGLDPEKHQILEIATVVTDTELKVLAEGPALAIYQPDSALDEMDDWCTRTHGESGLVERVRHSIVGLADAERQTLDFLRTYVQPETAPLCGNSIGQDRRFLTKYMPALASFFHYRNLDVSSLKILAQAWNPQLLKSNRKASRHRALDDVYDSIAELKLYRQKLLLPGQRR